MNGQKVVVVGDFVLLEVEKGNCKTRGCLRHADLIIHVHDSRYIFVIMLGNKMTEGDRICGG
jgi:hypothetical protein